MSLAARLKLLERSAPVRVSPEDCVGGPVTLICDREGMEPKPVPDDATVCPLCGGIHVIRILEIVVTSREDVAAANERFAAKGAA